MSDDVDRKPSFHGRKQRSSSAFKADMSRQSVFKQPVLKEGYLEKQSSGLMKKWQSRYFELSGHYLKYYEKKEGKSDDTLKGAVDLKEVSTTTVQARQITLFMHDRKRVNLRALEAPKLESNI